MAEDHSQRLRAFWKPGGEVNRQNVKKLKAWMKEHCLDASDIASFMYMDALQSLRAKAASDLKPMGIPKGSKDLLALRAYWKPKETINAANRKSLKAAMRGLGVTESSISSFLYDSQYQKFHKGAAKALGLV